MRSFPVRSACLLAFLTLLLAIASRGSFPRPDANVTSAPGASPRSSLTPRASVDNPLASHVDLQVVALRSEIDDLDRASNGTFSETLGTVLADPDKSFAHGSLRLPARSGNDDMLETFPNDPPDSVTEQRRLILVYVASAFFGCESDADRRARLNDLLDLYPGFSRYLPQQ